MLKIVKINFSIHKVSFPWFEPSVLGVQRSVWAGASSGETGLSSSSVSLSQLSLISPGELHH